MKVRRGAKKVRQQAKKKNEFRFKKTKTMHTVVQQHWDGEASVKHNLQQLGVADDPNRAVAPATPVASAAAATAKDPEAIFALPPVDKRDRNPRRRIMSQEDQAYIAKLLAEHGQDFKAMERDMTLNYFQHQARRLETMATRFEELPEEQRLV